MSRHCLFNIAGHSTTKLRVHALRLACVTLTIVHMELHVGHLYRCGELVLPLMYIATAIGFGHDMVTVNETQAQLYSLSGR